MKPIKKILKEELKVLVIAFVLFYVFFQIHYSKENPLILIKAVIAHFYLFIIPGYSLCLIFYDGLSKVERLILGIGVGYSIQPFMLYLINFMIKVNVLKYNLYVSGLLILLGLVLFYAVIIKNKKPAEESAPVL